MPIFDNYEDSFISPLPRDEHFPKGGDIINDISLGNQPDGVNLSSLVPLPNVEQPNSWSNSIADQLYTYISDVAGFLQVPVPDALTDIYTDIQGVESVLNDPVHAGTNAIRGIIYDALHPRTGGIGDLPKDVQKQKNSKKELDNFPKDDKGRLNNPEDDGIKSSSRIIPDNNSNNNSVYPLERSFFGYESTKTMSLRDTVFWDISVSSFDYKGWKNDYVPDFYRDVDDTVNSEKGSNGNVYLKSGELKLMDLSMPISSYNLEEKALTGTTISLFGGSSINIPDIVRYSPIITLQLVDDENKRWRRWLSDYVKALYDEDTNTVAPYKESSLLISLYQFRQDQKVLSHLRYICTLTNYSFISSGSDSPGLDNISLSLNIVGWINQPKEFEYLQIV